MNQFAYRPGTWQVIVEDGGLIAVPGDVSAERIDTLIGMMREDSVQLTEVIDVLTAGSIARLGSFAVALIGPDFARFAVRGDIVLQVSGADGDETVSGADISTWAERYIAQPRSFTFALEEGPSAASLSVRSGVVLASAVSLGESGERASRATDAAGAEQAAPALADAETGAGAPWPSAVDVPAVRPHAVEPDAAEPEPVESEPVESEPVESEPVESEPADAAEAAAVAPEPVATEPVVTDAEEPEAAAPEAVEPDAEPEPVEQEEAPDPAAHDAGFPTLIPNEFTFAPPVNDDESLEATIHAAPSAPPAPSAPSLGDHDGATISVAELRRLRGETAGPDAPTAVLPTVEPSASHGRARMSTGQVVELDRTVIIGRRPRATRASGDNMPHLVAVESPEQDISRSHLEIRPEGDSVVVIDLHTTNGSTLLRPGADPVRLHPGEQTLVLSGDVVDLGDGVTVLFEGLT